MKHILHLLFLVMIFRVDAQELVVVSKVNDDSISIKWLASTYEELTKIATGATVSRAESEKPTNFELVNFTNAKQWKIAPTLERYHALGTSEEDQKFKALLEPILMGSSDKEQQKFAVLTATVENMVNEKFQALLGNMLVDKAFDKRKTYVYKIEIEKLPPSYIYVDAYQTTFYSEIPEFELSLDRKRTVMVQWNSNAVQKESVGFLIEHSMDTQKEGSYLNELPHIPFKSQFEAADKKANVIDEPKQGHWHFYRVNGLDPFGHPSLKSEWKSIYVPLLVNAHVQIDSVIAKGTQRTIEVSASFTGDRMNLEKLNIDTWKLMRSREKDSGYEVIETKKYTDVNEVFTVNGKPSGDHFYYKIQALNEDDTVTSVPYYFFTLDQEPPVPPTKLNGRVDSLGIARLNWTASVDNDIRGYKVYRGNELREEFVERTTSLSTELSFTDTLALNNLTSEVYYFVKSIDLNYNLSIASDTVLLLKPDTIPPMSAALKSVKMVDTSLVISWVNSDSEDLAKTILIKNKVEIIALKAGQTSYTDYNLIPARHYTYQLLTQDKSTNQSYSQEVSQYYETGYRKALSGFVAKVDREQNHILLLWNAPQDDVFSYQLFRSGGEGKLSLIQTLEPKQLQYIDKNLSIGTKYTYSINYINQDGIHSLPVQCHVIY